MGAMSALIIILLSALAITSRNIVYSLVFLVLSYAVTTVMLVSLDLEFLGYSILIVYVGAVSVLFVFVVMTLDIRKDELSALCVQCCGGYSSHVATGMLAAGMLYIPWSYIPHFTWLERLDFVNPHNSSVDTAGVWAISSTLYGEGAPYLLLAGLLLLVSVVGPMLIILRPGSSS